MRRITLLFAVLTVVWSASAGVAPAQELTHYTVKPSETTTGIDAAYDKVHEIYIKPGGSTRDELLVFLPGTSAEPSIYQDILKTAAELSIPAIGLMYADESSYFDLATNNCDTCFADARTEAIEGIDLSPFLQVDRANSIVNRLNKLLQYLHQQHPTDGWGRFMNASGEVIWSKVIIAGHSQGAGHSAFIAKQHLVVRNLMFSTGDWYVPENRPATWILTEGQTPPSRIYAFAHVDDPLFIREHQLPAWEGFGIDRFAPNLVVEELDGSPYECSHMLSATTTPIGFEGESGYHCACICDRHTPRTADGTALYKPVWVYMLTGGLSCKSGFDGDAKSDVGAYDQNTGTWYLRQSVDGEISIRFGYRGTVPVEEDYDGDGYLDLGIYDVLRGTWHIQKTSGATETTRFGLPGALPVPADYDGDGKTDLAVYLPSSGFWLISGSRAGVLVRQFGYSGAVPVPGDYDKDRKTDLAVYDTRTGQWFISQSLDGFRFAAFGYAGAIPAQGDYDGDSRTDLAVHDPRTGMWYLSQSRAGFSAFPFGFGGAVLVNRDYDGDGRSDPGLYLPPYALWALRQSKDGVDVFRFGTPGATPLGTP